MDGAYGRIYNTEYEAIQRQLVYFSAQDKVAIDSFHRYRIFAEEHSENCTSVRVKGSYGIQYVSF